MDHMEGGQRKSREDLREEWLHSLREEQHAAFSLNADSLVDLEIAFRRVTCGKVIGPDRIPGEICHYAPKSCAKTNFATLWKLFLFGHEALTYKGGLLIKAYKGNGEKSWCSSFRSLLMSSHFGQAVHRAMRAHQATVFEHYLQAQQIGGRRAMPVTYGVHLARAKPRRLDVPALSYSLTCVKPFAAFCDPSA